MKAAEQYFPVILFNSFYKWFLQLLSLWMKSQSVTIQMNAIEQYFPVVLFIILYNVVLTFESVDVILKCDHPDESSRAGLSCDAVYNLPVDSHL